MDIQNPSPSPVPATPSSSGSHAGQLIMAIIGTVALAAGIVYFVTKPDVDLKKANTEATQKDSTAGKTVLTYAVHWSDYQVDGIFENGKLKSKGLKHYLEEYEKLHPDIKFNIQFLDYSEYPSKLKLMHDVGAVPDIYQIYSTWGVSFAKDGVLAAPPSDVVDDVKKNYVSTAGVTIDGKLWAIPSEVNDHVLLYNKKMFKAAGLGVPKTWNELVDAAVKLTKRDSQGKITQYGFAFLPGIDAYVVDPFLSLLFSNRGKYLSDDLKTCRLDEPAGVQALEAILALFKRKATDVNGNLWDFGKEKVAMVIMAPWTENTLRQDLGANFNDVVGTAPIPPLKESASLQYSWFLGVMEKSSNKDKAWNFLRWFTSEIQPSTGTTRYGDLLAQTIGAIPSRTSDIAGNQASLGGSSFRKIFVDELPRSIAEPNVAESSKIKEFVMNEIQAAWGGKKSAQEALTSACSSIEGILRQYYK